MAKSISGGIEPQMHKVSKCVSEIAGEFREKFKDIPVKVDFSRPESEMKKFQSQAENAQNALTRIMESSTADKQIKGIEKWSIALAQANNAIEQLQSRLSETTKLNIEYPKPKLSEYEDDITRHLQSVGAFGLLKEYLDDIKNSTQQATESARDFTDAFNPDAMASVFGESARDIENWGQVIERVGEKAAAVLHESPRPFDIATDGIEEAQQNIDSISSQLRNMGDLMKRAFTFSAVRDIENWRQLADGIKNYAQNAKVAAGIRVHTDDYKNVLSDIERTKAALEKLKQKKRDMEAAGTGEESREWKKIISDISAAESRLDSYMAKRHEMEASGGDTEFSGGLANQSWIKGMVVTAGEAMSSLRQKIGEIGGAVSQAAGDIPIIGRLAKESAFLGKTAFEGLKFALSGVVSVSGKAVSALSAIASGISKLVSGIKSAISKLSSMTKSLIGVKSASKGMNASLSGGLKTILKYGLGIRSLYALINKLRTATKEAFGNLAQYSSETNESLSMLKSSLGALKNSLAAAFAPIVNVIAPYLSAFIDMLTRAFNAVGRFFAALTGKSFAVQAVKNFSDYAAGVSKAGSAAKKAGKEAQAAVRPFDELKVISMNKDEDSGSTGGSGEISPADMFTTVPIESEISDFAQKIKDAWEKADFTEIGAILGAKLKNGLDSIDWEPIKKTAAKVGKSIGTLINGFVEVEGLADSIGRTAGEAINTGITGINAFLDNTHWDSVGIFIGEALNSLVDSIAWEDIGHFFSERWNAILATIGEAARTFDWVKFGKELANGINTAIADFDWAENGARLGDLVRGILDTIISLLENTDWKELGNIFDIHSPSRVMFELGNYTM